MQLQFLRTSGNTNTLSQLKAIAYFPTGIQLLAVFQVFTRTTCQPRDHVQAAPFSETHFIPLHIWLAASHFQIIMAGPLCKSSADCLLDL